MGGASFSAVAQVCPLEWEEVWLEMLKQCKAVRHQAICQWSREEMFYMLGKNKKFFV